MHPFRMAGEIRMLSLFAYPAQPFASQLRFGFAAVMINVAALHCSPVFSSTFE